MRVVGINGSPREHGNTAILIRTVFDVLEKEGIETEFLQAGGQPVQGCKACGWCKAHPVGRCVQDDGISAWLPRIFEADGLILGTPVYVGDVTPEIKAVVDRVAYVARANGHPLARKVGAPVVAVRRAGSLHALDTLNHFFLISQMILPGASYWNLAYGREVGEVRQDVEGMETMRCLGENIAWLLKKLQH